MPAMEAASKTCCFPSLLIRVRDVCAVGIQDHIGGIDSSAEVDAGSLLDVAILRMGGRRGGSGAGQRPRDRSSRLIGQRAVGSARGACRNHGDGCAKFSRGVDDLKAAASEDCRRGFGGDRRGSLREMKASRARLRSVRTVSKRDTRCMACLLLGTLFRRLNTEFGEKEADETALAIHLPPVM